MLVAKYKEQQQSICKSNLGHRLLYGLDEFFNPHGKLPKDFFSSLVRGSSFEQRLRKNVGDDGAWIRDIVTFLKRGGKFDVTDIKGSDEIDCARFFFKVLDALNKIKIEDQPILEYDEFCEAYAKVGVQAFDRLVKDGAGIVQLKLILNPLMEKFRSTSSWKLRSSIVKGLRTIAYDIPEHDNIFWDSCMCVLNYYEAASLCCYKGHEFPAPIREGVACIVDIWWGLAVKYGEDKIVRKKVLEVALRLLNLTDMARLELYKGLQKLEHALRALCFDTVDYITDEKAPAREKNIQIKLASLGYKLIPIMDKTKNDALKKTLYTLLPYLWGAENPRIRKTPRDECSEGKIEIQKQKVFTAHINNICGRSYRAFNITVDGIRLRKNYDYKLTEYYRRGVSIKGVPCQKIYITYGGLKKFVPTDKLTLEIPFINQKGEKDSLAMPCMIHRALKAKGNISKLVVWTPKKLRRSIPTGWRNYVDSLVPVV